MNEMKKFYIGIKALVMKDDRLLLLFDSSKSYWEVPGGRVDGDEQFAETLARELEEEIGYVGKISRPELVAASRLKKDIDEAGATLALLFYRVDLPEFTGVKLSDEHTKYEWVDKATAISRVDDEFKSAVLKAWEDSST